MGLHLKWNGEAESEVGVRKERQKEEEEMK